MGILFTDNFTRADSATVGNGWDESESPGEWQILGNKCRATTGAGNFASTQLKRPVSNAFKNGVVQTDYKPITNTEGMAQVWGRMQGANDDTGYLLYVLVGKLNLSKVINGALTTLNVSSLVTITAGVNYELKMTMDGSLIQGTLIDLDTSTLVTSVSIINTDVPGIGSQALSIDTLGPTGIIDYDNFSATEAEPNFTDNFTRADSATVGNGWEEERASAWSILSNKLRFTPDGLTGFDAQRCFRPINENFADGTVKTNFNLVGTIDHIPDVQIRMQGTSDKDGYTSYLIASTGALWFAKVTAGAITNIGTSVVVGALVAGTNYQLKVTASGNNFTIILTDLDTPTVLANFVRSDSTYPLEGRAAISNHITGIIDFDDFLSGTDIITLGVGDLGLLERFDGTLNNWVLNTAGGTAAIAVRDNDEKLVLDDTSGTLQVSATRNMFLTISGTYLIELDMFCVSPGIEVFELLDALGNVLVTLENDASAGQGSFDTDNALPTTFAFAASTYKMIVIKVDPVGNTVEAWYSIGNGATPTSWVSVSAAKSFTGAVASSIRVRTDNTAQGEARVDEIKIWRPKVFALGDSNTAGFASGSPAWSPIPSHSSRIGVNEAETHSYPYKLGLKYGTRAWVANRGVNADETSDLDGRVQADVIDQGAVECVVMVGTNDIIALIPTSTQQANISSVLDKLTGAGINVVLCTIPPSDNWTTAQNTDRNTMNAWIATKSSGGIIKIADVYTTVRDPSFPDKRLPAYADASNEHFTDSGLDAIASIIFDTLAITFPTSSGLLLSARRNMLIYN